MLLAELRKVSTIQTLHNSEQLPLHMPVVYCVNAINIQQKEKYTPINISAIIPSH